MPTLIVRVVAFLCIAVCAPGVAGATSRDTWRQEVDDTRQLADNDARQAYQRAQQLEANLPADATPADRARILNVLSRIQIYLASTDDAVRNAEQALALAKESGDKVGQIEADLNIALSSDNLGRMDALVAATTHSMTLIEDINRPELVTEAILRTAGMYGRTGAFDASMTMPMQAMDIAQRSHDPMALAYAHQGMAIALAQTGHWTEVDEHYVQMRDAARAAHSKVLEAEATQGIGDVLTGQGKLQKGESLIREALAAYRSFGGPFYTAHGLFSLASNLKAQKRPGEALALLDEVIAIYEKYTNKAGLWRTYFGRSNDYLALGRIDDAARDAQRAYDLAAAIGAAYYVSQSAQQMASIAAIRGEYQAAYRLSNEATHMKERADAERAYTRMVDLAQRYRTEAKQREIDELTRNADQQAVRTRWLWTVLGGSIAIFAGTAFFFTRLRRSHRMLAATNERLQVVQGQLQTLNANLEERVQARTAELRQKARYLRTLIDMLPMRAWFKDAQSRYLVTNQAHAQAFGSTPPAMVGKTDLDLVPRELALSHHADDVEVMASRQRKSVEELLPDGNGSHWVESYKAAVVDEDGTVLGTVGLARDISERKAAEEARDAALAEARRLAQARSDFLARISHELRTPLNGILGYAQILLRNTSLDGHQRAALNVIQQSGEQLLALINDILDLTKIEAGRLDIVPSDIPLPKFLRSISDMVGVRAEQKNLQFACIAAPDLPNVVRADERLLRQVLLNLLSNAVKFTDRGKVTLRVNFLPPGHLRFEIEDTGPGIAADKLETIFRPFEQLGEARRQAGGTGLGLAICREFMRLLGSEIRVESRVGEGSSFRFDVHAPPVAAAFSPSSSGGVAIGYRGPRKKILVVEDLAENRAIIADMLEPLGFDVMLANDGLEGIESVQAVKPDLVVMDIVMPVMDGYEATRRLREMPDFAQLPVIAISASVSAADGEKALAMGANVFLAKPIVLGDLLAQIGSLLNIEWIDDTSIDQAPDIAEAHEPFVRLPAEDMEVLHQLALRGNMRDIARHAAELSDRDRRYRLFADRLTKLAAGYQSKAILALVERYMERGPAK